MYHSKVLEENCPNNVSFLKFERFCQNYKHLTLSGRGRGSETWMTKFTAAIQKPLTKLCDFYF